MLSTTSHPMHNDNSTSPSTFCVSHTARPSGAQHQHQHQPRGENAFPLHLYEYGNGNDQGAVFLGDRPDLDLDTQRYTVVIERRQCFDYWVKAHQPSQLSPSNRKRYLHMLINESIRYHEERHSFALAARVSGRNPSSSRPRKGDAATQVVTPASTSTTTSPSTSLLISSASREHHRRAGITAATLQDILADIDVILASFVNGDILVQESVQLLRLWQMS